MKILLDTHIWLWYLAGSEKLSKSFRRSFDQPENELWISPISVWETLILSEKGKLEFVSDPVSWVREAMTQLPIRQAPLTTEVVIQSRLLPLPHQDPADRFIAATALVYDLHLATADKILKKIREILFLE